jgi:hypothetical protein
MDVHEMPGGGVIAATGHQDGAVNVWDVTGRAHIHELNLRSLGASVQVCIDGALVLCVSAQVTAVRTWDLQMAQFAASVEPGAPVTLLHAQNGVVCMATGMFPDRGLVLSETFATAAKSAHRLQPERMVVQIDMRDNRLITADNASTIWFVGLGDAIVTTHY